ncbi:hypothetical protein [Streptomonospora mangrovi]|nr:hypothetical protein [Streptomonospora mangrovi]
MLSLSAPASAAELAPIAQALDGVVAATTEQAALSATLASLGL